MSKHLPWFRFYTEAIDDEKLGLLAFEDRWHFVALLCLKGKGVLDDEPDAEMLARKVALKMGLTLAELEKVVGRLARMGLIDKDTFQPLAWDARQMKSDSSAERVQAYRERQKHAKQGGNVTVTAQDTDTDTDTEIEEAKASLSASAKPTDGEPDDGVPPCPFDKLIDSYKKHLPELPDVRRSLFAGGKNGKAMRSRWRWVLTAKHERGPRIGERLAESAPDGIAWFDRYFAFVADSDFLTGKSGSFTGCDLGWLVNASNFEKVLSGKYHAEKREAANA